VFDGEKDERYAKFAITAKLFQEFLAAYRNYRMS